MARDQIHDPLALHARTDPVIQFGAQSQDGVLVHQVESRREESLERCDPFARWARAEGLEHIFEKLSATFHGAKGARTFRGCHWHLLHNPIRDIAYETYVNKRVGKEALHD